MLLSKTHIKICPEDIFQENPSYGLRDIAITAVQKLKKGEKVFIDADNSTVSSRFSYIFLVQKKLPHIQISIVEILPKYGCEQLFWAREHDLAIRSWQGSGSKDGRLRDDKIQKWFASEKDIDVTYKRGLVEAPLDREGALVHRMKLSLTCETVYKLEVPGLLIECAVLQALINDGELTVGAITKVLKLWSAMCPCGRIIVVYDGTFPKSGVTNISQACDEIVAAMKQLTESFDDVPLYVYAVTNPIMASKYVHPPKPGLFAYLQRRHFLDLHSKCTIYLYESKQHMKMAERAGVPHLKGTRALEHPSLMGSTLKGKEFAPVLFFRSRSHLGRASSTLSEANEKSQGLLYAVKWLKNNFPYTLKCQKFHCFDVQVTSRHASVIPPIPDMLKTMEVKQLSDGEDSGAIIPLFDRITEFEDGCVKQTMSFGRTEYVFAEDINVIERYQALYASKASKVSEPGSKILDETNNQSDLNKSITSQLVTSPNISRMASENRGLPKWMLPRDESGSSIKSSLECSRSDSTSSTDVKIKQTVYVMTEKELTEVAMDILRQAGKTDLVEQFQSKQQLTPTNEGSLTPQKVVKQNIDCGQKKTKQRNIERAKKYHTNSPSSRHKDGDNIDKSFSDMEDKMSESDPNSWHSETDSAHRKHIDVEKARTDKHDTVSGGHGQSCLDKDQNKLENKPYGVEEVVTNVLDDLLTSPEKVRRKTRLKPNLQKNNSPVKRKQIKTELGEELSELSSKRLKRPEQILEIDLSVSEGISNNRSERKPKQTSDTKDLVSLQTFKESGREEETDNNVQGKKRCKRKTPDLTVLDELFG